MKSSKVLFVAFVVACNINFAGIANAQSFSERLGNDLRRLDAAAGELIGKANAAAIRLDIKRENLANLTCSELLKKLSVDKNAYRQIAWHKHMESDKRAGAVVAKYDLKKEYLAAVNQLSGDKQIIFELAAHGPENAKKVVRAWMDKTAELASREAFNSAATECAERGPSKAVRKGKSTDDRPDLCKQAWPYVKQGLFVYVPSWARYPGDPEGSHLLPRFKGVIPDFSPSN